MGVVGYGDIGQSAARIARAFKMNIIALRRREELSQQEEAEGLKVSLFAAVIHQPLASNLNYLIMVQSLPR